MARDLLKGLAPLDLLLTCLRLMEKIWLNKKYGEAALAGNSKIFGRIGLSICYFFGVVLAVLSIFMVLLGVLMMLLDVLGASGFSHSQPWFVEPVIGLLTYFGLTYLNMLVFFARLKRVNAELYYQITKGWPAIAYIGSAQSSFNYMDKRVAQIATDPSIPDVEEIRRHAKFTRYLTLLFWYYFIGLVLFALVNAFVMPLFGIAIK